MPPGIRTPGLSRSGLAAVSGRESKVRGCRGRGIPIEGSPDPRAGLPFRASAALVARAQARGDDRFVLAYPVAERRDVRRLSVEAADTHANAGCRYPGLS